MNEKEENKLDGHVPNVPDPFLERVKNTLFSEYFPIQVWREGAILLSSTEIYTQLQNLYPSPDYGVREVAQWLHEKGFNFMDTGNLNYLWMLMPEAKII